MITKKYAETAIEQQVPPSSAVLNKTAQNVPVKDIKSQRVQAIINKMYRIAYGRQGDAVRRTLVGLAAPQIGVSKRIVLIGINAAGGGEQPELRELINPEVMEMSKETEEGREACFSTGNVCGIVDRAKYVTVRAFDRNSVEVTYEFTGFPARVAQHEVDHLDGIRFPDRITDDSKLHWVEDGEFGDYRKHWQHWPVNCTRAKWKAVRSGKL